MSYRGRDTPYCFYVIEKKQDTKYVRAARRGFMKIFRRNYVLDKISPAAITESEIGDTV